MVVAFAPSVGRLLGLSAITVPWGTLVLSVVLYIVMPVIIAQIIRRRMLTSGGQAELDRLLAKLGPASLVALPATLVLLFGFPGEQIIAQPEWRSGVSGKRVSGILCLGWRRLL